VDYLEAAKKAMLEGRHAFNQAADMAQEEGGPHAEVWSRVFARLAEHGTHHEDATTAVLGNNRLSSYRVHRDPRAGSTLWQVPFVHHAGVFFKHVAEDDSHHVILHHPGGMNHSGLSAPVSTEEMIRMVQSAGTPQAKEGLKNYYRRFKSVLSNAPVQLARPTYTASHWTTPTHEVHNLARAITSPDDKPAHAALSDKLQELGDPLHVVVRRAPAYHAWYNDMLDVPGFHPLGDGYSHSGSVYQQTGTHLFDLKNDGIPFVSVHHKVIGARGQEGGRHHMLTVEMHPEHHLNPWTKFPNQTDRDKYESGWRKFTAPVTKDELRAILAHHMKGDFTRAMGRARARQAIQSPAVGEHPITQQPDQFARVQRVQEHPLLTSEFLDALARGDHLDAARQIAERGDPLSDVFRHGQQFDPGVKPQKGPSTLHFHRDGNRSVEIDLRPRDEKGHVIEVVLHDGSKAGKPLLTGYRASLTRPGALAVLNAYRGRLDTSLLPGREEPAQMARSRKDPNQPILLPLSPEQAASIRGFHETGDVAHLAALADQFTEQGRTAYGKILQRAIGKGYARTVDRPDLLSEGRFPPGHARIAYLKMPDGLWGAHFFAHAHHPDQEYPNHPGYMIHAKAHMTRQELIDLAYTTSLKRGEVAQARRTFKPGTTNENPDQFNRRESFANALRDVLSKRQGVRRLVAQQVMSEAALHLQKLVDVAALGPQTRASVVQAIGHQNEPDAVNYAAAWYGLLAKEPNLTVFHEQPDGKDLLHVWKTQAGTDQVLAAATQLGLDGVSVGLDGTVHVHNPAGHQSKQAAQLAKATNASDFATVRGSGHRIGSGQGSAADSRAAYRDVIRAYEAAQSPAAAGPG
jgi:hypothetical protein